MDFAVKTVVLLLLLIEVFGRSSLQLQDERGNITEGDYIVPYGRENAEIDAVQGDDGKVKCPTPVCADESCRIETPQGQLCPTCICEGSETPQGSDQGVSQQMRELDHADLSVNSIYRGHVFTDEHPRKKRSTDSQAVRTQVVHHQPRWTMLQGDELAQNAQQQTGSDEREQEDSEDTSEDYEDIQVFAPDTNDTNEIVDLYDEDGVVWDTTVPGCPTPLCENSSCRIGIPDGQRCPTCICSRRRNWYP